MLVMAERVGIRWTRRTDGRTDGRTNGRTQFVYNKCKMNYILSRIYSAGAVWRNHALKGIASQMSTLGENTAVRGVDDNADNIIAHNSCSVTHNENDPWWMVTFHNVIQVIEVAIASAQNGMLSH